MKLDRYQVLAYDPASAIVLKVKEIYVPMNYKIMVQKMEGNVQGVRLGYDDLIDLGGS